MKNLERYKIDQFITKKRKLKMNKLIQKIHMKKYYNS